MAWELLCLSILLICADILPSNLVYKHLSIFPWVPCFELISDMTHIQFEIDKLPYYLTDYSPSCVTIST